MGCPSNQEKQAQREKIWSPVSLRFLFYLSNITKWCVDLISFSPVCVLSHHSGIQQRNLLPQVKFKKAGGGWEKPLEQSMVRAEIWMQRECWLVPMSSQQLSLSHWLVKPCQALFLTWGHICSLGGGWHASGELCKKEKVTGHYRAQQESGIWGHCLPSRCERVRGRHTAWRQFK